MATGAGVVAYYDYMKQQKLRSAAAKGAVAAGSAAIGGAFDLVDSTGAPFTHDSLKGRWTLLYFGFTHCPDICPDELEKVGEAVSSLEARGVAVTPVFVSLDPSRDTPAIVGAYAREFHPRMVGVTGTSEEAVKRAARAGRVYYAKAGVSGADPGDYLIDHSIITYLVDPAGRFATFFGKNASAGEVADGVAARVAEWKEGGEKGGGTQD